LRLIYLGTPRFAVPTLEAILEAGHEVAAVVTQPDRPKGRGHALAESPVKQCALAAGLPVLQPERVRRPEAVAALREIAPEIMVIVGYGQIIPQSVIDIAPRGVINVHASLLPELRGAAPIQWAIARGYDTTGVTTMQIDAGLDTGDMLLKAETAIGPEEDAVGLGERLALMGAQLLTDTLRGLEAASLRPEKQDPGRATYAPILTKADGAIDWSRPAREIHNLIRGMQPWPGGHTSFRGQRLHIWIARLAPELIAAREPGSLRITREGLFAAGGDGCWLKLIEVQSEGRRRMGGDEFARGQRIESGEKLGA
jgi:methionyl-tRNA formyltransferase